MALVTIAAATAGMAAWMVALDGPVRFSISLLAGSIVLVLVAAQSVRPTDQGLHIRYLVRRRLIPYSDIADVGFAEFRQLGERLQRPAVITYSVGPIRLPGVEPSAPLVGPPRFPALARVERAWRDAVTNQ